MQNKRGYRVKLVGALSPVNYRVKGIKISDTEFGINPFEDGTSLFLEGDKNSYENSIRTLDDSAITSGLKLNYEEEKNW